jgi:hypothetical protein
MVVVGNVKNSIVIASKANAVVGIVNVVGTRDIKHVNEVRDEISANQAKSSSIHIECGELELAKS